MSTPDQAPFELRKKSKAPLIISIIVIVALALAYFFLIRENTTAAADVKFGETLKVHFSPNYAGEEKVIEFISNTIGPDLGIKLEAVSLADGNQADAQVAEGKWAASIYQHQWWLTQVVQSTGLELTATAEVFQWGFGLYSDKHKSVEELPEGALIALPDDGANQGQALWLLQRAGIIGLNKDIEPRTAKIKDIAENPKNFKFQEIALESLPRVLDSVDVSIGYIANFDAAKIGREKGILFPQAPRTFACRLVIGTKFLNDPQIQKLQKAFEDPRLQEWLKTTDEPLVKGVLTPVSSD
jgi:ABC-type metal ion transport system substrate-binding protein